jgi:hypothetical protein
MFTVEDQYGLATKSMKALKRIQSNRIKIEEEKLDYNNIKPNYSRVFFEEFDEDSFNEKIKLDSAYYNVLLKRLDEGDTEEIQIKLGKMMKTIRQIYEHINIKGKIYGMSRLATLDEPDKVIQESASQIITDFITRNYYSLTKEERQAKYMNVVKSVATDSVIKEGIEPEVAIHSAVKTAVVASLLESISFPMTVCKEIEHCLRSDEYAKMFNQDQLNELWDSFKEESYSFAKIVSDVV